MEIKPLFPTISLDRYIRRSTSQVVHIAVDIRQSPRPHCGGGFKAHEVKEWVPVKEQDQPLYRPCIKCLKIEIRLKRG